MTNNVDTWQSQSLELPMRLVRWGKVGTPVLLLGPATQDAEEVERRGLVDACGALLSSGQIKLYSVETSQASWWLNGLGPVDAAQRQKAFISTLLGEVVPRVRSDCHSADLELISVGIALGAHHAIECVLRAPEDFKSAVGMSGCFDLTRFTGGRLTKEIRSCSLLYFLDDISDLERMEPLRHRQIVLATGTGAWENPGESWWLGDVLSRHQIPNRVDNWPGWPHDWPTWQHMLPSYLAELVG